MKKTIKYFMFALMAIGAMTSCKKDENKITFNGGTSPVLSANLTTTIPLSYVNKDNPAVTFSWTNPNYQFTTGLSSQNVTYIWELDTTGANFSNSKKKQLSISGDLSKTLLQSELNDFMLNQLELAVGIPHNIEARIKCTIGGSAKTELISNVLKFTVTPYAIPPKVQLPVSGRLFMVGNATPGGWNNPVPAPAQEFTQVSPTLYELTLPLVGGNSYLFLPVNGSWDVKYGFEGGNNQNDPNGDNLKIQGGDMKAPGASGTYKIQVNFQQGKFKLTLL
jgi:hypothetical protein